jgi:hypothetical protein
MSRKTATTENKNRLAIDEAIAPRASYMSPSYLAELLRCDGVEVTRQLITRRYHELGIVWDKSVGLWIKQEKSHE